jgi:hypothetical protein
MKISELPQEIKELALLRQKERPDDSETDYLNAAFAWFYTEEGLYYWSDWHSKETANQDKIIAIIEKKIATMSSRGFESYRLPIGILKDLIREIKEIK